MVRAGGRDAVPAVRDGAEAVEVPRRAVRWKIPACVSLKFTGPSPSESRRNGLAVFKRIGDRHITRCFDWLLKNTESMR